jgi:hypothetical protein
VTLVRLDESSIAHRVRCVTTRIGRVVRCPRCHATTFEGFEFDGRRDSLRGQMLVNPHDPAEVEQLLGALLDMTPCVERECLACARAG